MTHTGLNFLIWKTATPTAVPSMKPWKRHKKLWLLIFSPFWSRRKRLPISMGINFSQVLQEALLSKIQAQYLITSPDFTWNRGNSLSDYKKSVFQAKIPIFAENNPSIVLLVYLSHFLFYCNVPSVIHHPLFTPMSDLYYYNTLIGVYCQPFFYSIE